MSRQQLEDYLKEQGAIIVRQVTKKTNLVIVGEKPSKSKIQKAQELGIPIVYLK